MTPRDDADAQMAHLVKNVNDFFTSVDGMLRQGSTDPALGPTLATIDGGLRDLRVQWDDLVRKVEHLFTHGGDAPRLRQAGDAWTSFGNSIGAVAGTVAPDQMVTTIGWEGSAAEAYRLIVPAQHDALGQLKASGGAIGASLNSLADQVDDFWTTIKIALVVAGTGLLAAIFTAADVVTVPGAIVVALSAIGAALVAVSAAVVNGHSVLQTIETEMRMIRQNVIDIGPQWPAVNPTAAAAMNDASTHDDTPSQWRPR